MNILCVIASAISFFLAGIAPRAPKVAVLNWHSFGFFFLVLGYLINSHLTVVSH